MIDTHAHLHLIDGPLASIISDARFAGIEHIVQVAIDWESLQHNVTHYQAYDCVSVTGGIHPLSISKDISLSTIMRFIESNKDSFCAIGETGLDYKYGHEQKLLQQEWFIAHLELARQLDYPVIIHSRHSDDDMLAIVNQYPDVKKVFHCYATNIDFYQALNGDLNYVSFTGMITYSKKGKVVNACRQIPLDRIMIETDAPYLIPQGITDHQNKPQYVAHIASSIAKIKQINDEDVRLSTTQTAHEFLDWVND